jgi:sugar phosphate isomerase/epimerase
LIGPAPLAKRYVQEIREEDDNFGLMVDLSHIPMLHETCAEAIGPIKDYLVHAHMGNTVIKDPTCEAYGDTHPRFGFSNSEKVRKSCSPIKCPWVRTTSRSWTN